MQGPVASFHASTPYSLDVVDRGAKATVLLRRAHWPRRMHVVALLALCAFWLGSCTPKTSSLPSAPASLTVTMREYRFDFNRPVPAGRVVLRVENSGTVQHQLALIKLDPDVPPLEQQLRGGSRRAAPNIALILRQPGASRTLALDLSAGRYGMVCFLRAPDGEAHALKGMNAEFRVG